MDLPAQLDGVQRRDHRLQDVGPPGLTVLLRDQDHGGPGRVGGTLQEHRLTPVTSRHAAGEPVPWHRQERGTAPQGTDGVQPGP